MYRSAAKRCFLAALSRRSSSCTLYNNRCLLSAVNPFSTSATSDAFPSQKTNVFEPSTTSTTEGEEEKSHASENHAPRSDPLRANYEEEKARVLSAALHHVRTLGWSEAAMMAGARDVGVSPSIVGAFPRKDAAIVEFFMDDCLQRLVDISDSEESLKNLTPSQRLGKLVRTRLEMQAPYYPKWAQALSIQARPLNVPTSFKQRAMLMDEIWHGAGDDGTDVDWYVKRTILGGLYTATELYMLTDVSAGFRDTWAFLDGRIKDAFDLKNTAQEVKYLAEAVTAGTGNPIQGVFSRVFSGK